MIAAPALMPAQPLGANPPSAGSVQLCGRIKVEPTAQKKRITPIFSATIAVFELADSLIPITRMTVISMTIRNAGRLAITGNPKRDGAVDRAEARYRVEGSAAPPARAAAARCADR